jgi:cytochrome c-type biogenesis protein CcmH/NrfG
VTRGAALALGLALVGCAAAGPPRDPLTAEQHNDRGVAYFERNEPGRAVIEFERAVALRPGWARGLVNLGDARLAVGDVGGAVDAYARAVAITPDDPGALNNLAWALLQDPVRWPEAEPIIEKALARQPEPRGYYLDTLGVARLRKGDGQGALDAFRAALADTALPGGPSRALVLEHAGEALLRLGDPGGAAHCRALATAEAAKAGRSHASAGSGVSTVGEAGSVC